VHVTSPPLLVVSVDCAVCGAKKPCLRGAPETRRLLCTCVDPNRRRRSSIEDVLRPRTDLARCPLTRRRAACSVGFNFRVGRAYARERSRSSESVTVRDR